MAGFDTKELEQYEKFQNLKNAIELLKIISGSLREKEKGDRYWIKKDSLKELFNGGNDKNKFSVLELYLGLIYQQSLGKDIKFTFKEGEKPVKFTTILKKAKESKDWLKVLVKEVKDKIDGFIYRVDRLETSLKGLKVLKDKEKKLNYNEYYKFYDATLDTFEYSLDLFGYVLAKKDPRKNDDDNKTENAKIVAGSRVKKYLDVARALGDIYLDVNNKNYGSVVFNVVKIFDKVFEPALGEKEFKKIREKLLKYGSFMAAVAKAETSDEVNKAIESVALPVGSYRIKRTRNWTISMNSYVGLFGSKEGHSGMIQDEKRITNFAFTAPVGLAVNKGFRSKGKYVSSLSLFLSIIDVGAIVRFRLEEEENELSEVRWKDIIAPGLFLVFGPKNFPLSVGFGVQLAPKIKKVYADGSIERTPGRIRWGLIIGVDIPLIHFK